MVRINKNEISIFGLGRIGHASYGVTFNSQSIPSELWSAYWNTINFPRWLGSVGKRYPFRIKQLESTAQLQNWQIFRNACNCFGKQPTAGGATPPNIGPRNRSWWYDNDPGVPPIYFNYFMQETLNSLHSGINPVWCRIPATDDAYVFSKFPDTNYGFSIDMFTGIFAEGIDARKYRSFIKIPAGSKKTLYLYMDDVTVSGMPQRQLEVRSVIPVDWEEDTITWNEFTPLGDVLGYFDPPFVQGTWLPIYIGAKASVCIKLVDEAVPADGAAFWVGFATREESNPIYRPYFQDAD